MDPIEIVHVEQQLIAVVRKDVPFAQMPHAQRDARRALAEAFKATHMTPGRSLTVWRPPKDGIMDYAPGAFVDGTFEAGPEVSFFNLPQGRAASFRLRGAYEELPAAWQHLFDGCKAQALEPAGLNWEIYTDAPPGTTETELYALLK